MAPRLATHSTNSEIKSSSTPGFFRPRVSINQPGDVYEQEADAVAEQVMRMPDPAATSNLFFKPGVSSVQRKCAECEEEEKQMQRKENSDESVARTMQTENYVNSLTGGRSLKENERSFFETRMNHDFTDVRIHTDADAAKSARSINALAYTTGNNIVFNEGQFAPDTDNGKKLLGHELTHVIQQKNKNPGIHLVQRADFSPWPGQVGEDVAGTYSSANGIISERVQRKGDPNFAIPMPSLLEFNPNTCTLTATMEINFIPETNAANKLTTEEFNETKARVLRVGNERLNGWVFISAGNGTSCPVNCRNKNISIKIIATEGTGPAADTVTLGKNYDREDAGHIGRGSSEWTIWHEMGHIVLGAPDEYSEEGRPAERVNESDWSIMASSSSYGRLGLMHARHFSHLAAWLSRKFPGCNFETVEASRPLIVDWTPYAFVGGFGGKSGGLYYSTGIDMGIPLDSLRKVSVILGPRFNFLMQSPGNTMSLLAGLRAGLRLRTSGSGIGLETTLFGEGGGLGFTDLESGTLGVSPYGEGGIALGVTGVPFLSNIKLEAAGGERTATVPADKFAGTPATTEGQAYFRFGANVGFSF